MTLITIKHTDKYNLPSIVQLRAILLICASNNETPCLLDQIWTNFVDNITTGILSVDITDHCPIFLYFSIVTEKKKHIKDKIKTTFRHQSLERTSASMDAVVELDFSDIIASDPSTYVHNFLAILNELYCRSFPICNKFISKRRMSKLRNTTNILSLIKQKSNAFQQFFYLFTWLV